MVRSLSGPRARVAFSATFQFDFSCRATLVRVLLLSRLRAILWSLTIVDVAWPPSRSVRWGKCVGDRVCWEGARVSTNVMVRDLVLRAPIVHNSRRLEVVTQRIPIFGVAHVALDTNLVSALHCDGSPRRHAANVDGVALWRRKDGTYPELVHAARSSKYFSRVKRVGVGQLRQRHFSGFWSNHWLNATCDVERSKRGGFGGVKR